jgi:hypothetical protein
MPIVFEGEPPYEPLIAIAAQSEPIANGVLVTVTVEVDGLSQPYVPIQFALDAGDARSLAGQMGANLKTFDGRNHQP